MLSGHELIHAFLIEDLYLFKRKKGAKRGHYSGKNNRNDMRLPKNNVRKNRLLDRFIDGKKYTCDEGNFEEYGYQFFKQFFIVEITFPDFFCH